MVKNINDKFSGRTKELGILTNVLSKKYWFLYLITFMVSIVNMGQEVSPFSLAIVVAATASEIPVMGVVIFATIGNAVGSGLNSILTYFFILLLFLASFLVKQPIYNDDNKTEKMKLGRRIAISTLIVSFVKIIFTNFMIYDILVAIIFAITVFVFYKIFVNSLNVIVEIRTRKAFSIEEIIGSSLLLSIALCALGDLNVLGFSIKNIFSIFIVLLLGWKNGMLIGATSGVTIGVTLGIIDNNNPEIVAAYAISGLIAGLLNKLGRPGVIIGFILGNIILTYASSGGAQTLIIFKEILIAGIALLAVPKNINISAKDLIGKENLLPVGANYRLNRSNVEVVEKLNNVSKAVEDMADNYKKVVYKNEENEKNKNIFKEELSNNLPNLKQNMFYKYIEYVEGDTVSLIYELLNKKQYIMEKDFIAIIKKEHNYIFEENELIQKDLKTIVDEINSAYQISKLNFIWDNKLQNEKDNIKEQLSGVSKAISDIAKEIKEEEKSSINFQNEISGILEILKQKDIITQDIFIKKNKSGRFIVDLYLEQNTQKELQNTVKEICSKVLNENICIVKEENNDLEKTTYYKCISDDKYIITFGQANKLKNKEIVSGDSILKIRLEDGKYLVALSDGMGSGPKARQSSQIVVKMLKRLLNSGFEKETSVDLINSSLLNVSEDVFASLDIAIIDLYKGNIEFIKSGACPTYIKNNKKVQIIKSIELPSGILKGVSGEIFDKDIESGEVIVMCTDGIIDSNVEYKNKELWVKYILEDMENDNPQKIADILMNEAIDNNFGKIKDDMSVITCKLVKK